MKRFSKILALALAVAMMLGMTAMAGTLYYQQDFKSLTDLEAYYEDSSATYSATSATQVYDVAGWRTNGPDKGINIIGNHSGIKHPTHVSIVENGDGNNSYTRKTINEYAITFVPKDSWDGTKNQPETYVISFDLVPSTGNLASVYYFANLVGLRGNEYNAARILAAHGNSVQVHAITSGNLGNDLGYNTTETKRVAFGFKYDSATGGLKRDDAVDGVSKGRDATSELKNMTTVEAIGFSTTNGRPNIGKLRMYTINDDEGFKVTTDNINGQTGVLPSTNKVTIAFNQPVGAANVAVTANGTAVDGITTAVREIISGDSITSEVDVMFANPLSYGTTYAINLSNVTNEVGDACVSAPITFETLAATVTVDTYEGLAEGNAIEVANAAGKTVYVKATVVNSNSVALNGKVIIGIYDNTGLVKYASATKALAANGDATFAAAFKLAAGQRIVAEYK